MKQDIRPCIQVVGFKNSGKTTLMANLVETFGQSGIKTATLKHHGHGGKPKEPENVDSSLQLAAGAVASGVEGDGRLQLSIESMSIDKILKIYHQLSHDVLLIEGYKELHFPKVVMIRKEKDLQLLSQLTAVVLVIVWKKEWKKKINFPSFSIEEEESYIKWLLKYVEGGP